MSITITLDEANIALLALAALRDEFRKHSDDEQMRRAVQHLNKFIERLLDQVNALLDTEDLPYAAFKI